MTATDDLHAAALAYALEQGYTKPAPPPPPPPPAAAPLFLVDYSTGDTSQWRGGYEIGNGLSIGQRVTVAASVDGVQPFGGVKVAKIHVNAGDQFLSSTGWRTLLKPGMRYSAGADSTFVFDVLVPVGYPGVPDGDIWVAPFELHHTGSTGVAPVHIRAFASSFGVDVQGGDVANRKRTVDQTFLPAYRHGVWTVIVARIKQDPAAGSFELWAGQRGGTITEIVSKSGIPTMYSGYQTYVEFGLYRAQSGTGPVAIYHSVFAEYADSADALAFAGSLL